MMKKNIDFLTHLQEKLPLIVTGLYNPWRVHPRSFLYHETYQAIHSRIGKKASSVKPALRCIEKFIKFSPTPDENFSTG